MGLITPDVIEEQCIDVIKTLHCEHLAKLASDRSLTGRIEDFKTVDLLIGSGVRLRDDKPPVLLLGVFGTDRKPERSKDGTLVFDWTLAVQITTIGTGRSDVIKRRAWYAMTAAECLLQRLPRHAEPVDSLELLDVDFTNGTTQEDRPRTVGEAQLLFSVRVRQTLSLNDLPPADTELEPGSPGGPPESCTAEPEPWPQLAEGFPKTTTDRAPLDGPLPPEDEP